MNTKPYHRNVGLLSLNQAVLMSSTSLFATTAALVGQMLAPRPELATVPIALVFLGMMATTIPASYLMRAIGRRGGFMIGLAAATLGAGIATVSILEGSFAGFCAAALLFGVFNAIGQYYRFAAVEAAPGAFRSRAISLVLAGGVAAAFIGPRLAAETESLLAVPFAGSFAALFGLYAIGLLALLGLRLPKPERHDFHGVQRPLREIARQPVFVVAVTSAVVGWATMNLVMTATPLAMVHHAHTFGDAAFIIQWHVLGMFAPSFVTGSLMRRFGVLPVMLVGTALLAAAVGINLSGTGMGHFFAGLVALGIGWNFLFVGATDLLTQAHTPAERAKVQGVNEFLVFGSATLTSLASGAVEASLGWGVVNLLPIPLVALAALAMAWLLLQRRRVPATA